MLDLLFTTTYFVNICEGFKIIVVISVWRTIQILRKQTKEFV